MRGRGIELAGYRPKESIIDVAVESALDTLKRLQERLALREGSRATGDLVLGIDVVHVEKQGNNIRTRGVGRVDPEPAMIDDYTHKSESLEPSISKTTLIEFGQPTCVAGRIRRDTMWITL